jgi:hypothetical protein
MTQSKSEDRNPRPEAQGYHALGSIPSEGQVHSTATGEPGQPSRALIKYSHSSQLLTQLQSGQLFVVDSRRRCGLIVYKQFHAEFVGPGAAVGGIFDIECHQTIPVGDLVLLYPESYEERQKAFVIRRHWIRLMERLTVQPVPLQRTQMLLTQFQHYFDRETVVRLPDEAIARLVGVLPQTVRTIRPVEQTSPVKVTAF